MIETSPWALAAIDSLTKSDLKSFYSRQIGDFNFEINHIGSSLWVLVNYPKGGRVAFRAAFSPNDELEIKRLQKNNEGIHLELTSVIGTYKVDIAFPDSQQPLLHYRTSLKVDVPLFMPYWPRDILFLGKEKHTETFGKVYVQQVGTRSGAIYCSLTKPKTGALLYLQNLTALNDYFEQTQTSGAEVVGGEWPELGLSLPQSNEKAIPAGKEFTISDAFVAFDTQVPADQYQMARQYLDLTALTYLHMPKPATEYHEWHTTLKNGLNDVINNPGCWSQVKGHSYLNAYVSDYTTPPEIMVQLAVLLPLLDYVEWSGEELPVMKTITEGLPTFYNEKIGSIMRWLPAVEDKLDGSEEQKLPKIMDSWYLLHPLLNLSRLALKGDKQAEKLFMDSLNLTIKIAHHFKYQWPVFYKIDTLEVVKEETEPGKGGEKDVAGLYAHVMLQAWELTKDKRYLNEAEKAASTLKQYGFDLFYQANNTAFSAGAMLRLYKQTKNEEYLNLSYLCLACLVKNMKLWDCNYGNGKSFQSFFAVFPLNDAPYTAAYEEMEVFCALHDYLVHAEGVNILPSISLLLAEFIRYLVNRARYYYPTMLPKEVLSDEVKMGEVDPDLWIALEDLHDGWEKSGEVGQEVYGAGNAFGILPRHYRQIKGETFLISVDYPTAGFSNKKNKPVTFSVKGDERLNCRMVIIKSQNEKLPAFTVEMGDVKKQELKGKTTKDGNLEYMISGNQKIKIQWRNK